MKEFVFQACAFISFANPQFRAFICGLTNENFNNDFVFANQIQLNQKCEITEITWMIVEYCEPEALFVHPAGLIETVPNRHCRHKEPIWRSPLVPPKLEIKQAGDHCEISMKGNGSNGAR